MANLYYPLGMRATNNLNVINLLAAQQLFVEGEGYRFPTARDT